MELSRKKITSIVIGVLAVVSAGAMYTYWNSSLNQIIIIIEMVMLVFLAMLNGVICDKRVIAILSVNAASLIITYAFHRSMGVTLTYLNLLLACFTFNSLHIGLRSYRFIHLTCAALWFIMSVASIEGAFIPPTGNEVYQYCSFGIVLQKNFVGIISLGAMFHWCCFVETLKIRKIIRIALSVPVIIIMTGKILESKCRSATLAAIAFIGLYFLTRTYIRYGYYYVFVVLIVVASGIFTIYYVNNIVDMEITDIMGGNAFNRLGTWQSAFSLIDRYPVFGSGTDMKMGIYDSAHNTVLSIIKTIGIIPTITYGFVLVKRFNNKIATYSRVAQIAVISGLAVSFFESYYVESYFCIVFLLFLVNPETEAESDTEDNSLLLVREKQETCRTGKIY